METNNQEKSIENVGAVSNEKVLSGSSSGAFAGNTKYGQDKGQHLSQGRPIRKRTNPRYNKAEVHPPYPNTIYNAVAHSNKTASFSRKDLRRISNIIKTKHSEKFNGVEPEKIEQIEDGQAFQVYCYPEVMRKDIKNIVAWYFRVKKEKGAKHERTVKLETLDKMKRENSPDYEMALVKFNMAEEERRKKEKLAQAEQAKKDKLKAKYNKSGGQRNAGHGASRTPYNKDRQYPNSRSGQFNNRNNQSQNSSYKPREFNRERENVAPAVSPKPATDATNVAVNTNINEIPALISNVNENKTPPKPGFLESFLNKIKGNTD